MSMNNRTVIVITGPTASGKTSLGVSLALALGTEVVSADSMQLYRGMDIGSAKPTREEMRGVPHHMIDVADPAEDYSVSRWVENAAACCETVSGRRFFTCVTVKCCSRRCCRSSGSVL